MPATRPESAGLNKMADAVFLDGQLAQALLLSAGLPGLALTGRGQPFRRDAADQFAGDPSGAFFDWVPLGANLVKVIVALDAVDGGAFALLGKYPIWMNRTHIYCVKRLSYTIAKVRCFLENH
jgi:hypothetical protein